MNKKKAARTGGLLLFSNHWIPVTTHAAHRVPRRE